MINEKRETLEDVNLFWSKKILKYVNPENPLVPEDFSFFLLFFFSEFFPHKKIAKKKRKPR